jgi:hypothetical protein
MSVSHCYFVKTKQTARHTIVYNAASVLFKKHINSPLYLHKEQSQSIAPMEEGYCSC